VIHFAEWLSTTLPSVFIQEHNAWAIPTIQSIHIVGIAMVMGSVLMIDLRILGWAGTDHTLRQTISRFGPWLTGSLWLLLATLTFFIWAGIIVLGRLIAYDHVWGSWSPSLRQ
jgi:hypothetical protein